jgi:serine/threonine protein kinase/tetratricopeptide (TPR) repeat protein
VESQQWRKVVQAFNALVDLAATQRASLLDAVCGGDAGIRAEVESMLSAHDSDPEFLNDAPLALPSGAATVDLEGSEIGAYRVLHRIGGGGMGDVYLAQRNLDQIEQPVALKVVQRAAATTPVLHRFLRERRILASLDHPHICRLLDTGVTTDGRPYLVMPYLEAARPITQYCDQHRLDIRRRVALLETVCAAVHHAHQHLVVHADLKPANILVTPHGQAMLLDFGISRLLRGERGDSQTTLMSADAPRPLTPEFASPEQLRGEMPTTASDVYSLGIVLHELLCGSRPYAVDPESTERTLALIERATPRPSTQCADAATERATTGTRLRALLRGDLDNIVAKALHPEPARRYGSVSALSDDLRRWAQGLPVMAHAPSVRYQMRKFVGRHRLAVGSAALTLIALIGFATTVSILALRITRQADQLRVERDRAESVVRFMADLFNTTNPMVPDGGAPSAEQMLDRGVRLSASLGAEERMQALTVIGGAYTGLGRYEPARATLDTALALPEVEAGSLAHAAMLRELATLDYRMDQLEPADAAAGRAYAEASALLAEDDLRLVPYLNTFGMTAMDSGRTDEAESLLRRAIALRRTIPGYQDNQEYADSLRALADILHTVERFDEAGGVYDEAIEVYTRSVGPDFPLIAITLNNQSAMLRKQNRIEDALTGYERARDIAIKTFGEQHPFVGVVTNNVGRLNLRLDRRDAALAAFRHGVVINRAALPPSHPTLARSLGGFGEVLLLLRQPGEAAKPLRESFDVFEAGGRGDSAEALETLMLAAQALIESGNRTDGLALLRRGTIRTWALFQPDHATRKMYQTYLDSLSLDAGKLLDPVTETDA